MFTHKQVRGHQLLIHSQWRPQSLLYQNLRMPQKLSELEAHR